MEAAQLVAQNMISAAREHGFMESELTLIPELAEIERALFMQMLAELPKHLQKSGELELTLDEISSMFVFVYVKAAEAVTNYVNGTKQEFDLLGLFDGKIPFASDDRIIGYFKQLNYPEIMATAFVNYATEARKESPEFDPLLALFEALKWTWRIAQHLAANYVETL